MTSPKSLKEGDKQTRNTGWSQRDIVADDDVDDVYQCRQSTTRRDSHTERKGIKIP